MQTDQKMSLVDRLTVAQDIIVNVKNEMKAEADQLPEIAVVEKLERMFIANKLLDAAIALGKAKITILDVENEIEKEYGGK